jgi:3-deoxy-D-manno-octulosonic-acid transferase
MICVQTEQEAERFAALGVERHRLAVTGNLKFDQEVDPMPAADAKGRLRRQAGISGKGPVIVAGSTHPGEEAVLAGVFVRLKAGNPRLQMVVAPRDPDRAAAVRRLLDAAGISAVCLEAVERANPDRVDATVVDRIGLLRSLYAVADVAFVGGSLLPFGGHNPLEPAAWKRPVVFGPDMSDFSEIAAALVEAGGAVRVNDSDALFTALRTFFRHPETAETAGRRAYDVFAVHRGAVERTLAVLAAVEPGVGEKG